MTTMLDEAIKDFNQQQADLKLQELQPITVSEALRKDEGRHTVLGVIISRTDLYNLVTKTRGVCQNCKDVQEYEYAKPEAQANEKLFRTCKACGYEIVKLEHNYINAVTIWLQDKEPKSELERLPVVLFKKDNENIGTGELVSVVGQIHIVKTGKSGRLAPIVHAEGIRYENREELTLTAKDIGAIKRFALLPNCSCGKGTLLERLTSLVGLPVVGHKLPKQGLLLAALGSEYVDDRVASLFAGDPGEAKSKLAREGTKLIPNSRYVTAQYSTGRSMTAIIDKENDLYVLKYGPAAMARKAICAINELGKLTYEDQAFLFDILQEGYFNLNKHGFNIPIEAPTTIIATTNQIDASWRDSDKISDSELPIIKPLRDRFDLVFVFRRDNSSDANRNFAYRISEREGKDSTYNSNFIRKYIHYARKIKPRLTDEAKSMLNEHWVQIASNGDFSSKRILQTLYKLAKGFSRLRLNDVADVCDAESAISFYNMVMKQYGRDIAVQTDPRIVTLHEIQKIVLNSKAAVSFEYALEQVVHQNPQVKAYIGTRSFKPENNWKVRAVYDMMKQAPGDDISIVSQRPLVLTSDTSDTSAEKKPTDATDANEGENQRVNYSEDREVSQ